MAFGAFCKCVTGSQVSSEMGYLSLRPDSEGVDDASWGGRSSQHRTPPLSKTPRVVVEEVVILEFEQGNVENIVNPKFWGKR